MAAATALAKEPITAKVRQRAPDFYIINPEGILQCAIVHDLNIGRSADETLRVLQRLQTGGLCSSDWTPGQENLKV